MLISNKASWRADNNLTKTFREQEVSSSGSRWITRHRKLELLVLMTVQDHLRESALELGCGGAFHKSYIIISRQSWRNRGLDSVSSQIYRGVWWKWKQFQASQEGSLGSVLIPALHSQMKTGRTSPTMSNGDVFRIVSLNANIVSTYLTFYWTTFEMIARAEH